MPLGIFSCNCGFIYQRVGPDKNEEDRFKFNSVREYGNVWEHKLSEYWQNSNISVSKIAAELKTSSCKITRHAIRLGLSEQFVEARQIQGYARYRNPRKSFTDKQLNYRSEWLYVLGKNPEHTRQELIDLNNFYYQWLRRHDSIWLEEHLPPVAKVSRNKQLLNWESLDHQLYDKIEQTICKIKQEINPQIRVGISQIIKRVGYKKWIDKREIKLPLITKLIDKNLESLEDFMIRKIYYTTELYFQEKKVPTRLQFQSRSRLRNKTSFDSKKVQNEIDKAIDFLKNNLN